MRDFTCRYVAVAPRIFSRRQNGSLARVEASLQRAVTPVFEMAALENR